MYKTIHIGEVIHSKMKEEGISFEDAVRRLKINDEQLDSILKSDDISVKLLLKISKLLEYDFFRHYSMHMLLYAPPRMGFSRLSSGEGREIPRKRLLIPEFKKNAYTVEIIQFILKKLERGEMTVIEAINKYNIPKTTIYRWKKKYSGLISEP